MDKDPQWLAFYGLLQVNAHVVERIGERMERETGVPPAWFEVLALLSKGPVRMSELAAELTLSRGGATRLVARMEDAGLVERETPKDDRRATYARITDAGLATAERVMPAHRAAVEELFSRHFDERQANVLRTAFARILVGNGIDCGPITTPEALAADEHAT